MPYSINTNIMSLQAQDYLRATSDFQQKTINRVTSGLRIISSGDDAAGLAIANGLRSDEAVLTQGVRNANDGLSTLQTIDAGVTNISKLLDRARTLATQSASGTFTGDRNVLNSEFQSVLSEIDRQARAIGLDTNGQFARNLSVFIGGGKANGSDTAITNGAVSVNLSSATLDSKSLGLKGVQSVGAAVDIGSASNTSVSKILADYRNTTATSGYTDFYFAGPGFSDANKVKVDVNLQNVSDIASLMAAINAAIQGAGNVGAQAGTAFKNANIVASVKQNADGTQQLAFTSSAAAFQVQSGDKMANALMGNVKLVSDVPTTEGADMNTTTATGAATTSSAVTALSNPAGITFRFLGAGMAQPVDITLGQGSTSVGTALVDLSSQVANNDTLKAAGITMTDATAGDHLQFSSARGEKFDVQVAGDLQNRLGFGSFQKDSLGNFDYNALTAGGTYDPAEAVPASAGTATLEFSINGVASNGNSVAIDLGDSASNAQAASLSTGVLAGTTAIAATNDTLRIAVDGTIHSVTLTHSAGSTSAATLTAGTTNLVAAPVTIAAATSGSKTGGDLTAGVDTTGHNVLQIKVDGGNTQTFVLTEAAGQHADDIVTQLTGHLVGATAANVAGKVVITSNATGTSSTVQVLNAGGTSAHTLLGFDNVLSANAVNGNNKMTIATDGGAPTTITLTAGVGIAAATLVSDINTKYGSSIASLDGTGHFLVLHSATTGTTSSINLSTPAADSAYATLGLVNGTAHGTTVTDVSRDQIASDIAGGLGGGVTVKVNTDNTISIQSVAKGAGESIEVLGGTANADLGLTAGTIQYGVNRTATDLTNALNQAFSADTDLQSAGLVASYDSVGKQFTITSNNGTMFRVNAIGGATAASMLGEQSVATGGNFDFTGHNTLSINGQAVTLTNGTMTAVAVRNAINGTTGVGVTASVVTVGGADTLKLVSTATGSTAAIAITGNAAAILGLASSAQGTDASFGYGVGGTSFTGNAATASSAKMFDAGGESATSALAFTALANGNDQQAITITASDASGTQQSKTITLQDITGNRSGRSLDEAIHTINSQLQQSNIATLQKVMAVKVNDGGAEKIKFESSLNSFTVSIGTTANNDGLAGRGTNLTAGLVSGGSTADITTLESASGAVSALAMAVIALGSAQAVVGKGENQFNYAISLAQTQVTNLAAAESRIRDADLAAEAANLTKASILQQAGLAALAQANSAPQAVLVLLRT